MRGRWHCWTGSQSEGAGGAQPVSLHDRAFGSRKAQAKPSPSPPHGRAFSSHKAKAKPGPFPPSWSGIWLQAGRRRSPARLSLMVGPQACGKAKAEPSRPARAVPSSALASCVIIASDAVMIRVMRCAALLIPQAFMLTVMRRTASSALYPASARSRSPDSGIPPDHPREGSIPDGEDGWPVLRPAAS